MLPAPSTGAARPETRYTYAQQSAWYKNASGTIVQSAYPIYKPTGVSQCITGVAPACVGTAEETRTEISYGTGSASTANNLLPRTVTQRSGNTGGSGAVSSTTGLSYDTIGNVTEIDGPLGGDDVSYRRYNANRELVGEISPRPVAADPTRRATRITRNAVTGLVEAVEAGTVEGVTNPDWTAFTPLQKLETAYNPNTQLPTVTRFYGGSGLATLYQLTQSSYDLDLRPRCTAARVALAVAPGTQDCTQLSTTDGYDQIAETVYSTIDGRVQKQRSNNVDEATFAYTANGQVQTVTDAKGNTSTYRYDAYDRRDRLTYANATTNYEDVA